MVFGREINIAHSKVSFMGIKNEEPTSVDMSLIIVGDMFEVNGGNTFGRYVACKKG